MKLVLSRQEIKGLREMVKTIDTIDGIDSMFLKDVTDRVMSKKAYVISIVTGSVTVELNELMVVKLLKASNELYKDMIAPAIEFRKLCLGLVPSIERYNNDIAEISAEFLTEEVQDNE